jgi:protocatechuate 3,4-dioxygenase beta subunit
MAGASRTSAPAEVITGCDGGFQVGLPSRDRLELVSVACPPGARLYPSNVSGGLWGGNAVLIPASQGRETVIAVTFSPPSAKVCGHVLGPDGQAVAGAKAVLVRGNPHHELRTLRGQLYKLVKDLRVSGKTDANGRFAIAVPPGCYALRDIIAPTRPKLYLSTRQVPEWKSVAALTPGARAGVTPRLTLGGTLRVTVRDPEGRPLKGASVRAEHRSPRDHCDRDGTTDGAGLVELTGLPPGLCRLRVSAPEGAVLPAVRLPVRISSGETAKLDVDVTRGATLKIKVLDEAGRPVRGVKLFGDGVTDENGECIQTGLATGRRTVGFSTYAYPLLAGLSGGAHDFVDVVAGGDFVHTLRVRRLDPASLKGVVTDVKGKPVRGAKVFVNERSTGAAPNSFSTKECVTDDLGRYRLSGLNPGSVQVQLDPPPGSDVPAHPSWLAIGSSVTLESGKETSCNLQLPHCTVVRVLLRDARGVPIPGAQLRAMDLTVSQHGHGGRNAATSGPSNEAGLVRVWLRKPRRKLRKGERRVLTVDTEPGRYLLRGPVGIDVPPVPGSVVEKKVTLIPAGRLSLRVTDAGGQPVEGAFALAELKQTPEKNTHRHLRPGRTRERAVTDRHGRVVFESLRPGEWSVSARLSRDERNLLPAEASGVPIKSGVDRPLHLVMKPAARVEGWVVSADGKRLRASVWAVKPGSPKRAKAFGTGGYSSPYMGWAYRIDSLPPGRYELRAAISRPVSEVRGGTRSASSKPAPELTKLVPRTVVEVKAGQVLKQEIRLMKKAPGSGDNHEVF